MSAEGFGEPQGSAPMDRDVFAAMDEARRDGRTVVMGTTVRTDGDPPSAPGNRALFAPDGALLAGTIGCNGLDRKAGRDGAGLLAAGERSGIRAYTSFEGEPGEGVVEVFLEAFAGPPRLVVGGAGPVADALAAIGGSVGPAVPGAPPRAGADLGRLHSPTGLDLGARRPPEIALSILAEVMAVTHARPGGSLSIVGGAEESPE